MKITKFTFSIFSMISTSLFHLIALTLTILYVFYLKQFTEANPLVNFGFIPFIFIQNALLFTMLFFSYKFGILKNHYFIIPALIGLQIETMFDALHDILMIIENN